jgi:hypothetical protein
MGETVSDHRHRTGAIEVIAAGFTRVIVAVYDETVRVTRSLLFAASAASALGCSLLVDAFGPYDSAASGPETSSPLPDGSALDALPSDADAGPGCPDPSMINVGAFCIDSTEVTTEDYEVFAANGPDAGIPQCAWKTSYEHLCGTGLLPVGGVDWCDAYAYCASKGKRLCGKIHSSGTSGGAVDMGVDLNNQLLDEWFYACTQGGSRAYPYGSSFDVAACNGKGGPGDGGSVPSGSLSTCQGGFAGIYDMSGNVWEWENACDDAGGAGNPAADNCVARGGSWARPMSNLQCANTGLGYERNVNEAGLGCDFGIHCCADPVP